MNKDRKRRWWTLFLLVASGIAILIGFYLGMDKGTKKEEVLESEIQVQQKTPDIVPEMDENLTETEGVSEEVRVKIQRQRPPKETFTEEYCADIEAQVREFFQYLDTKDYTRQYDEDKDSYGRFKDILERLSVKPPQPAGEGLVPQIMNKNIFYLFRLLDGVDVTFIREVLQNEADTIEMDLELFYIWLMLGDRCPDNEKLRPSQEVIYQYAGFFINTIGGRAYLFRRPTALRLLITYYSMMIIYDADKRWLNSYGIDIFPEIEPLLEDIKNSPSLRFKDEYVQELKQLQIYYKMKGRQ